MGGHPHQGLPETGFLEWALIAIIALLLIGPERLPDVARTVGRAVGKTRRLVLNFQRQLEQEVRLDELNRQVRGEAAPDGDPSDEVEPAMPAAPNTPSNAADHAPAAPHSQSCDDSGKVSDAAASRQR